MRVRWRWPARFTSRRSRAEAEEALTRQAAFTRRTIEVSRPPGSALGSHVLGYADTEEHALFGTPDQVCAGIQELREVGVAYVLLQFAGGTEQLRRFALEVIAELSPLRDSHE